jgi:hypothetical protein
MVLHLHSAFNVRRFDEGSGADSSDNDSDSDTFTAQRTTVTGMTPHTQHSKSFYSASCMM